jgi:ABC-type multidrug transport system ATPase subunit
VIERAKHERAIELRGVSLTLGGRAVLSGVDLEVAAGESVGLVGPNGSGKSSLLRSILGLVPFTGTIRVGGFDARTRPIDARTRLAWVPQKPAFGDATALDALAFVARLRRLEPARELAWKALRGAGLAAHAKQGAKSFSGGMQQRLALAMALLTGAPVMLMDEPTASLDREGQRTFLDTVMALREQGRTLLLASHRPEEIARLTDRVVHLEDGRLTGRPDARVIPLHPRHVS